MYDKASGLNLFLPFLFVLTFFLYSCSEKTDDTPAHRSSEIEIIGERDIEEIINNRNGNILFINVWATWCVPCVEEFPALVKTADHFKNKNVEFVSFSVDLPSEKDSLVVPFIEEHNVNFPVYIIDESYSEEVIELLNKEWSGAIPATFIYNEDGEQVEFILGARSYEIFKSKIDSVLTL